ncbi:PREDICTED: uncharacterized protein LOC106124705 [Papilio xuthus]|uniref:Uncharacterized protein LOC106124705 n=1 Tax=Papilio xuthus TaxID=66420 RepID=A0AAJ6ZQ08_PAPXU|nr:PREDICTED: uncharacterized protein LOC106124705 [Papilio xuthus]
MNKKYFQLPNIAPKPAYSTKSNNTPKDDISLPTENTYINKYIISINKKKPTLPTSDPKPIIDLTNDSDDTQFDSGTTPIITSVYSLATQNKQVERPSRVITPILIPQNNINTDLATITKVQSNVGSLIIQNTSDGSALVPVSVAGQQIYVQQSAQAQCTTDAAGRRFLILPKSQLLNGNSSLLLPKVKIGNASLTCNPVDHIQKMIAPTQGIESEPQPLSLMPWVPLDLWAQGKSVKELVLLQIDASKPAWTLTGGQAVVTLTDYTCESPIYCSLPAELKTRIMFPQENNGMEVYNPPTLQIYEDAANGTTSFAKWVKSVIDNTENEFTDDTETIDTCENRPVSRIKVKSFARLTKNDNFIAPCRVCLQDRLYMKVSERPLKYAKVITAVPSLEEFHNLVSGNAPLKLLPKNMTSFDSLQTVNLRS